VNLFHFLHGGPAGSQPTAPQTTAAQQKYAISREPPPRPHRATPPASYDKPLTVTMSRETVNRGHGVFSFFPGKKRKNKVYHEQKKRDLG
jgi:hypothetical protein